jgi:hypothetical protein
VTGACKVVAPILRRALLRTLIVDDSAWRQAMRLLTAHPTVEIVGEADPRCRRRRDQRTDRTSSSSISA